MQQLIFSVRCDTEEQVNEVIEKVLKALVPENCGLDDGSGELIVPWTQRVIRERGQILADFREPMDAGIFVQLEEVK